MINTESATESSTLSPVIKVQHDKTYRKNLRNLD